MLFVWGMPFTHTSCNVDRTVVVPNRTKVRYPPRSSVLIWCRFRRSVNRAFL